VSLNKSGPGQARFPAGMWPDREPASVGQRAERTDNPTSPLILPPCRLNPQLSGWGYAARASADPMVEKGAWQNICSAVRYARERVGDKAMRTQGLVLASGSQRCQQQEHPKSSSGHGSLQAWPQVRPRCRARRQAEGVRLQPGAVDLRAHRLRFSSSINGVQGSYRGSRTSRPTAALTVPMDPGGFRTRPAPQRA